MSECIGADYVHIQTCPNCQLAGPAKETPMLEDLVTITAHRRTVAAVAGVVEARLVELRNRRLRIEDVLNEDDGPARMFAEARAERRELTDRIETLEAFMTVMNHGIRQANERAQR